MKLKLKNLFMLILLATSSQTIVAMELKVGSIVPGINLEKLECEELGLPYIDENDTRTWEEIWDPILEQEEMVNTLCRENDSEYEEEEYEDEDNDSDEDLEDFFAQLSLSKNKKKRKPISKYLEKTINDVIATVDSWEPQIKLKQSNHRCGTKITEVLKDHEAHLLQLSPYTQKKLNKELLQVVRNKQMSQTDKILSIFNLVSRGAHVNSNNLTHISQKNNELLVWITLLSLGASYTNNTRKPFSITELTQYKRNKALISKFNTNNNNEDEKELFKKTTSILQECNQYTLMPNMIINGKFSMLHLAVLLSDYKVAIMLLEHGAYIDIRSAQEGLTPLHLAILKHDEEMVELLICRNANVNLQRFTTHETPLHLVVRQNNNDLLYTLLHTYAIDFDLKNSDNQTAKQFANCYNPGMFNQIKDFQNLLRVSSQDSTSSLY